MHQKRFLAEEFIILILLLNPYRNIKEITNTQYYLFICIAFVLKLWK